jgi:hypothetical protein
MDMGAARQGWPVGWPAGRPPPPPRGPGPCDPPGRSWAWPAWPGRGGRGLYSLVGGCLKLAVGNITLKTRWVWARRYYRVHAAWGQTKYLSELSGARHMQTKDSEIKKSHLTRKS